MSTHKKRRILICTSEYPPVGSGIAHVVYNLRLAFKPHIVKICSPIGPDIQLGGKHLVTKAGGLGIIWFWLRTARYLKKHVDAYDAVLLENPLIPYRLYSRNITITPHTLYTGSYPMIKQVSPWYLIPYYWFMKVYTKWCYWRLDTRIPLTSAADDVTEEIKALGVDAKRITYISNGADLKRFKPASKKEKQRLRKKLGLDPGKPTILFVGRLEIVHQPLEMIRIFAELQRKRELQFVILGGGSYTDGTKLAASSQGLTDISFIPRVPHDRIHEIYQACDYFFINSVYTGQSLTVLEAMASGLPLLAPDIRSFQRIATQSKAGCLFTPNNSEQAAKDVLAFLKKPRAASSKRAANYARKHFDWQRIGKDYLKYMLEGRRRKR